MVPLSYYNQVELVTVQDKVIKTRSLVTDAKAIKNDVELSGFRACHIRDGSALACYFSWLEEMLGRGETITEWQGAEKLAAYRS